MIRMKRQTEFVAICALLMSSVAMSIDIMLPSLGEIAEAFELEQETARLLSFVSLRPTAKSLSGLCPSVPLGVRLLCLQCRSGGWYEAPPLPEPKDPAQILDKAEAFIAATGADIRHGGNRAFYRFPDNFIQMPERKRFMGTETSTATESYYSTLLMS